MLMATQTCGAGLQAEKVAMGPVDQTRWHPVPHMKFRGTVGPKVETVDRELAYFRQVEKETK